MRWAARLRDLANGGEFTIPKRAFPFSFMSVDVRANMAVQRTSREKYRRAANMEGTLPVQRTSRDVRRRPAVNSNPVYVDWPKWNGQLVWNLKVSLM